MLDDIIDNATFKVQPVKGRYCENKGKATVADRLGKLDKESAYQTKSTISAKLFNYATSESFSLPVYHLSCIYYW